MKGQYEQHCNAVALKEMGIPVLKSLKLDNVDKIKDWVENGKTIKVDYPDQTEDIINTILAEISLETSRKPTEVKQYSVKKFRNLILKKIIAQI